MFIFYRHLRAWFLGIKTPVMIISMQGKYIGVIPLFSVAEVPEKVYRAGLNAVTLCSEQSVHQPLVGFSFLFQAVMLFHVEFTIPHHSLSQLLIWRQPLRLMHKFLAGMKTKRSLIYCQMPLKACHWSCLKICFFLSIKDNPRHENRTQIKACALISKYFKNVCTLPKDGDICGSRSKYGCPIDLFCDANSYHLSLAYEEKEKQTKRLLQLNDTTTAALTGTWRGEDEDKNDAIAEHWLRCVVPT